MRKKYGKNGETLALNSVYEPSKNVKLIARLDASLSRYAILYATSKLFDSSEKTQNYVGA